MSWNQDNLGSVSDVGWVQDQVGSGFGDQNESLAAPGSSG